MTSTTSESFPDLIAAMKLASAALRDADVPHLLGGGLAAWARGGPPTEHDVDFFVREADAERALQALVDAGMTPRAAPGGLAPEGVVRGDADRPDLPPGRRPGRRRALRARRAARGDGAAARRGLA